MLYVRTAAVSALLCLPQIRAAPAEKRQSNTPMVYGFDKIEATAQLNWRPCFDKFTCTKLEVPLDYEDEAAGTTHIAFIKYSSNSTTANSTQDILMNPGGPGGSGITFLTSSLPQIQATMGTDNNFVSFDPRGVNNSGPSLSCFPGKRGTSRLYRDYYRPMEANNTYSYHEVFQKAAALGDFCTAAHNGGNDAAKYANTVATATDMLHYTELLAKSKGQNPQTSQLWYYGISYGTVLGTTFASLFPDRVGRIAVDGVVDAEDYYQGKWLNNLVDADEAIETFFEDCYKAGKGGNCTFWAESPSAIKARYQAVVDDISTDPIPVSNSGTPDIATIAHLKRFQSAIAYNPIRYFPVFATVLAGLEKRNATALVRLTGIGQSQDQCQSNAIIYPDEEPRQFIACTDANGRNNLNTFDAWVDHANTLIESSKYMGEFWAASTAVICRNLKIKAPASQVFHGYPSANQTSNPLLFLSTKLDPVTPLRHAEKMTARFGGARLLVQDSVGHATTSAGSKCTHGHVKNYFKDATLPDLGTRCQPDQFPFRDTAWPMGSLQRRGLPSI